MTIPRKFYAKTKVFPISMWDQSKNLLEQFLKRRVDRIKAHTVSHNTVNWRRRAAQANIRVRTHTNTKASVLGGSRLGMRTGTLLKDIAETREPWVKMAITDFYGSLNSRLLVKIDARKYYHRYPLHFQNHLITSGALPEGILGVPDTDENIILDSLKESVWRVFKKKWAEN